MATTTTKTSKKAVEEKKSVYCQLTPDVHAAISAAADREFRSVAAQMEMIATQWAEKQRELAKP